MIRVHFFREKQKTVRIPVTFYSKTGKKRLIKIWNDHKLSDQPLFASIANNSNASAIREKVTDYMQNYLQACLKLQKGLVIRQAYQGINERETGNGGLNCKKLELQQHQSSILERKQKVLVMREALREKCLQDEARISKLTTCECDQKAEEMQVIEVASASTTIKPESSPVESDNMNDVISHDCDLLLPPLQSRSSGFEGLLGDLSLSRNALNRSNIFCRRNIVTHADFLQVG